jgi:hypothetical protein
MKTTKEHSDNRTSFLQKRGIAPTVIYTLRYKTYRYIIMALLPRKVVCLTTQIYPSHRVPITEINCQKCFKTGIKVSI